MDEAAGRSKGRRYWNQMNKSIEDFKLPESLTVHFTMVSLYDCFALRLFRFTIVSFYDGFVLR